MLPTSTHNDSNVGKYRARSIRDSLGGSDNNPYFDRLNHPPTKRSKPCGGPILCWQNLKNMPILGGYSPIVIIIIIIVIIFVIIINYCVCQRISNSLVVSGL